MLNIAIFAQTYHRIDGRSKFYDSRKTTHAPPNAYEMSDQMLQNSAKVCYNKLHQVSWIKLIKALQMAVIENLLT